MTYFCNKLIKHHTNDKNNAFKTGTIVLLIFITNYILYIASIKMYNFLVKQHNAKKWPLERTSTNIW